MRFLRQPGKCVSMRVGVGKEEEVGKGREGRTMRFLRQPGKCIALKSTKRSMMSTRRPRLFFPQAGLALHSCARRSLPVPHLPGAQYSLRTPF